MLIILTTVPKVYLNYQKSNQIPLDILNHNLAKQYLKEGHFAEGSMKPKIEAALSFIGKNKNRKVVITNAGTFKDALSLKNGTLVVY
jgi:carbamate kinase